MEEILKEIFEMLRSINYTLESINNKFNLKTADTLPDAVTVDDIKTYLNIGAGAAYEIINRKEFTRVNLGRKICVPKEQFLQWVERDWRKKRLGIA